VNPVRARELAAALGQWADGAYSAYPESIPWAISKADQLVSELMRLERAVEARRIWNLPGHPFAYAGGRCLHVRDCLYVNQSAEMSHRPLTRDEAEAYLRGSHDHRRCVVCAPCIPEPPWVRVRSASGRVRWRLADDVELPP